ncbi:MAG: bifunctional glutamate N-acetyltransferase/amino-acid acetyltransferase ArgJ [Tepidiformaceae bacterium]
MTTGSVDPAGNSTSPMGFQAGSVFAGMKTYGEGKLDLAILASDFPCTVAATFTRNVLHSASVDVNRAHLASGRPRALVVNAGIANSSTGARGLADGEQMAAWAGEKLGLQANDVLVCSTGVIGHFLPMEKVERGIAEIELRVDGGQALARAIMTTDTRPKGGSVNFGPYTLGGCCKGSGMIHPNMATMLAFLTTDAPIEQGLLQRALSTAVGRSFNLLSIDGDTSPSDTVLLFANGAAGGEEIRDGSPLQGEFEAALEALCTYLAKEMARDGEGATKLIEVTVTGAASAEDAAALIRLMTTSYLLKSAVHGADPNWGRVVAVAGRSAVQLSEERFVVEICGTRVFERQEPTEFDPEVVAAAMRGDTVTFAVHLGVGDATATGWGCDLSAEYVSINADYHT